MGLGASKSAADVAKIAQTTIPYRPPLGPVNPSTVQHHVPLLSFRDPSHAWLVGGSPAHCLLRDASSDERTEDTPNQPLLRADNPQVYFDLALGRYGDATPLVRLTPCQPTQHIYQH